MTLFSTAPVTARPMSEQERVLLSHAASSSPESWSGTNREETEAQNFRISTSIIIPLADGKIIIHRDLSLCCDFVEGQFGRGTTYNRGHENIVATVTHNDRPDEQSFNISRAVFDNILNRYKEPHEALLRGAQLALANILEHPSELSWQRAADGRFDSNYGDYVFSVAITTKKSLFGSHTIHTVSCAHQMHTDVVVSETGPAARMLYERCSG